jgi:uncharacterized protein
MHVLITGGTGMIGRHLTRSLVDDGHDVTVLTRSAQKMSVPAGAVALEWDGRTSAGWGDQMGDVDAVVNLVGKRISSWPWTARKRKEFWASRVNAGQALVEAIRKASRRPRVLIQASGVNYYGPRGLEQVTEKDRPGNDFLAQLSQAWEASTKEVESLGVRRVITRSAIVLNANDGTLPLMMLPVKFFIGGPLGRGDQGLAWIHEQDEVRAIRFLLEAEGANGPFNLCAPNPPSSAEFIKTLAHVLRRPYWFHAPAFALRIALGGMATLILDGIYTRPERLQMLGFTFQYSVLEEALHDLLGSAG